MGGLPYLPYRPIYVYLCVKASGIFMTMCKHHSNITLDWDHLLT